MKYRYFIFISLLFISCQKDIPKWHIDKEIPLGEITPIGITQIEDHIWLSDGDHNRLAHLNKAGQVISTIDGFERPMHIDSDAQSLYIPEYGTDNITIFNPNEKKTLILSDSLDAPASIDIHEDEMAIADFYNHRILYSKDQKTWMSIGKKGKSIGKLYYPTDVEIFGDKIYVADAYNNRVQVFDKSGKSVLIIGEDQKINAATGIHLSQEELFVTDFENDKIHVYNHKGLLLQTIEGFKKPTDLLIIDGSLYVTNYKGKSLSILKK